jgi:hypothetical protein
MSLRVLYVIACAAPPTSEVDRLVSLAQERGWDVRAHHTLRQAICGCGGPGAADGSPGPQ